MNVVIALHRILEKPDFLDENIGNVISFDFLKKLIEHFREYSFVGLQEFLEDYTSSDNLISLTFDDGNSSVYHLAYPFLHKRGIPFSVFVNSHNILTEEPHWFEILEAGIRLNKSNDLLYRGENLSLETLPDKFGSLNKIKRFLKQTVIQRGDLERILNSMGVDYDSAIELFKKRDCLMNPSNLKSLSTSGVEVASHGRTHQILARLSESEQEYEILQSKKEIGRITQKECKYFSYPNGWITDYNLTTIEILKRGGYRGAFAARVSLLESEVTASSNNYEIPRWCPSENSLRSLLKS